MKREIFLTILFFLVSVIKINSQIQVKDNYILINADSQIEIPARQITFY